MQYKSWQKDAEMQKSDLNTIHNLQVIMQLKW